MICYQIKSNEKNLFTSLLLVDDCIYRFYICTERFGTWPDNRNKCTLQFKNCSKHIMEIKGNEPIEGR